MLTVGDKFPRYHARACFGNDKTDLKDISNEYHAGKWACYLFYPKDFTFVCPTELVEFGRKAKEFKDRDCLLLGGSTDNEYSHLAWRLAHPDLKTLPYPLIAANRLAKELRILEANEQVCYRATFLVDPHGVIQWASVCPLSVGRSVAETLRVLDAIQSDELCPCNWKPGDAHLKV
jgi:peroxiredoxin (alkyl hydroperoxide reductase subunit C)